MRVSETPIPGVLVIEPDVHHDERGVFFESWHARRYAAAGVHASFVQDNVSWSRAGVLRGLHFQHPHGQAKLVSVLDGAVFDVCVDVRHRSPTFGAWHGVILSSENRRQMMIPAGFAHGFLVTGTHALFSYKTSDFFDPSSEATLLWNDPALAIAWPLAAPTLAAKDARGTPLAGFPPDRLPAY